MLRRFGLTPGAVIALIALVLSMSAAAFAGKTLVGSDDLKRGSVTAPKIAEDAVTRSKIQDGAVTTAAFGKGALAPRAGTAITATEADFAQASNVMSAVVNPDGTLARAHGVFNQISSARVATGSYHVTFLNPAVRDMPPQPFDVSGCSWIAGLGLAGAAPNAAPGSAFTRLAAGSNNVVAVDTFDVTGNPADSGFHLQVVC